MKSVHQHFGCLGFVDLPSLKALLTKGEQMFGMQQRYWPVQLADGADEDA